MVLQSLDNFFTDDAVSRVNVLMKLSERIQLLERRPSYQKTIEIGILISVLNQFQTYFFVLQMLFVMSASICHSMRKLQPYWESFLGCHTVLIKRINEVSKYFLSMVVTIGLWRIKP